MNKTFETMNELSKWYSEELERIDKEATDLDERFKMMREVNDIRNKYMYELLEKESKENTKEMIYTALLNIATTIDEMLGTQFRISLLLRLPM